MPDLFIRDKGSLCLLSARSKVGKKWMAENLPDNRERTYYERALVVEHRYIRDIADGAAADGLWVREVREPLK